MAQIGDKKKNKKSNDIENKSFFSKGKTDNSLEFFPSVSIELQCTTNDKHNCRYTSIKLVVCLWKTLRQTRC